MIQKIITDSDIILYWELTDCQGKSAWVYVDGSLVLHTQKTHFTLRDLKKKTFQLTVYTDEAKQDCIFDQVISLCPKAKRIDITQAPYCAVGDGVTMNTAAIQRAINDCGAGECVYIPRGTFLSGALVLHSDMELYIEKGGILQGSEAPEDYLPKIKSRFEGIEMECYSSLLNMGSLENRDAYNCRNILIHGGGRISGGGKALCFNVIESERERLKDYIASLGDEIKTYENNNTIPGRARPRLINITCCQNVVLENVEIYNGPCWNVHMLYSDNILTCNSSFYSHGVFNGDGWDPDSSTNCTIFNCDFNTGDDCVAIKSGKNPEGNIIGKPSRNIRVFDCRCETAHGFVIGSEMSGGVSDVYIWDCDMANSIYGIEIKGTKKRGGYVRNVHVSRCTVSRVLMHAVGYNDDGIGAPEAPIFSDCTFQDVRICGEALEYGTYKRIPCNAIEMVGFDGNHHSVQNIRFTNVVIGNGRESVPQTVSLQMLKNISFENLTVE